MITMFRCFYSCRSRLDYYLGPDHRNKKQKNFPAADSKQI